jgi:UDP-N-acetylglucosamine transferase subunit ALG13
MVALSFELDMKDHRDDTTAESSVPRRAEEVFVVVGNARQPFRRLLEAVDDLAGTPLLRGSHVVLQTGHDREFEAVHCDQQDFFPPPRFEELMARADVVICHGGNGTIFDALRAGKRPVVMPRRRQYGEHLNDHQLDLVRAFNSERRIFAAYEPEELPEAVRQARSVPGDLLDSTPSRMITLVERAIVDLIGSP